ncbi:MAG: cell division protein ZapE [Sphingobacteriia bacterium]|nr:cell division protein ZapE [Sphingobacteriia bacterium]
MPELIRNLYKNYLKQNNYNFDKEQENLSIALDNLLKRFDHFQKRKTSITNKILGKVFSVSIESPKGLYIYGGVGKGKTFLMKLFFESVKTDRKLFIHFHDFIKIIHENLHVIRNKSKDRNTGITDPIQALAEKFCKDFDIICLDELHLLDVSDAMILSRVFAEFYKLGMVFVVTSNREPEDLYKQDYGKEHFRNFIEQLLMKMEVYNLTSPEDYRMNKIKALKEVYFVQNETKLNDIVANVFKDLEFEPVAIEVMGRELKLRKTYKNILLTDFKELCENPLSQLDYIEICKKFALIIINNIPKMSLEMHNEAKRFMMLIDQMYNHNVLLICNAYTKPEELYLDGKGAFEFQRTISRLNEMQSESYIKKNSASDFLKGA